MNFAAITDIFTKRISDWLDDSSLYVHSIERIRTKRSFIILPIERVCCSRHPFVIKSVLNTEPLVNNLKACMALIPPNSGNISNNIGNQYTAENYMFQGGYPFIFTTAPSCTAVMIAQGLAIGGSPLTTSSKTHIPRRH